jgi:hypothetical protein
VPEGVTLLEFKGPCQEEQQPTLEVQEVEPVGEMLDEVIIDCPDHVLCNFMKGKTRSIISLLISEMQLCIMLYFVALNYRCWMKTLVALISNPYLENIP